MSEMPFIDVIDCGLGLYRRVTGCYLHIGKAPTRVPSLPVLDPSVRGHVSYSETFRIKRTVTTDNQGPHRSYVQTIYLYK